MIILTLFANLKLLANFVTVDKAILEFQIELLAEFKQNNSHFSLGHLFRPTFKYLRITSQEQNTGALGRNMGLIVEIDCCS